MSENFTKNDLIDAVHRRIGKAITKFMLTDVFNIMTDYIYQNLKDGHTVSITNFGTFSITTYPSRPVKDYLSKTEYMSEPSLRIKFRTHPTFDELVEKKKDYYKKKK